MTSTTTTTYTAQDRPETVTTAVTGLSSSTAIPATTTTYNAATGEVTGTTSAAGTTGMTYDTWGRQLTYINTPNGAPADTGTTTYNALGQVVSVIDGNGATTYTYDGTDATGVAETRGLVTAVAVKLTGGTEYTSTAAYDHTGALIRENLPGKIIRRTTYDIAGDNTGLTINGQAINEDTSTFEDDKPWLGWSTTSDVTSTIIREWTPSSSAGFTGSDYVIASDRRYTYDQAHRLTAVSDWSGNPDPDTGVVPCVTRTYGFDTNGNRTTQAQHPADCAGECASTGGASITRAYDAADRPITGANGAGTYTYDQLGRQTTIPSTDAPDPASGDITLSYYDTDNIRTINQGTTTATYALDGADRRLTQTTTVGGTTTGTLVRHYTDASDNPTWSVDIRGADTTTTRYAELANGDLSLTLTQTSAGVAAELALSTPRGDTAAAVTLPTGATGPTGTAANGIDTWNEFTEYGTPRQSVDDSAGGVTGIGYGWLGTKQRSTIWAGLTLMGARVYNAVTGLFSSVDPVDGGSATRYGYPTNPVNATDLDGKRWFSRQAGRFIRWRARATGGSCSYRGGIHVCQGSRSRWARNGGTTYGDTYITRSKSTSSSTLRHERGHVAQWNKYGASFAIRYAWASAYSIMLTRNYYGRNRYEHQAGYRLGGYSWRCATRSRVRRSYC